MAAQRGSDSATSAAATSAGAGAPFLRLSYSYVPLVWAATLAYHSQYLLGEAGRVLQVGERG